MRLEFRKSVPGLLMRGGTGIAPVGSLDVDMDGWPFVYATMSLGNVVDRTTVDPAKSIIAYSNTFISQSSGTTTSSAREITLARLVGLRDINSEINIVYHIDYLTSQFDIQATVKSGKWLEKQIWDNPSDFAEYFLADSGDYLRHTNGEEGLAFNWDCSDTVMQRVVEGQLDEWTDFDGTHNLLPISWMQDSINEKGGGYAKAGHAGTVSAVESSTEIDVPTWSGVSTDGNPDGNGYENLTLTSDFICWQANKESGDYRRITGHKVIDGSTDRLELSGTLENMTVANGSGFSVLPASGRGYGTSGFGGLTQTVWRAGIHNFGDRYISTVSSDFGFDVDVYCNGANRDWTNKKGGDAPTWPTADDGYWGGRHFEWINTSSSFTSKPNQQSDPSDIATPLTDGYRVNEPENGRNYEEDELMMSIEYNKLLLKTNAEAASGYPCLWLNALTLRYASNQDCYAILTAYDAAYIRFWYLLSWCMTNVMPQCEAERHDVPVWIDEVVIAAGNPVTTRNFGVYDPEGNSGVEGTFVWDTADFGTFGYVKWFDNCCIVINLRDPGATDPWVPSWEPVGIPTGSSGQTITSNDTWTVTGIPAGKKLTHFDPTTYTNSEGGKFDGKKATDFDSQAIMRDTDLNTGSDVGSTVDCGPFECMVLMIEDA